MQKKHLIVLFPQDEHDLIIDLKEELSTINYKDYWVLEEYHKYPSQ